MNYKELYVRSETAPSLKNELLFEIVSEKVSGTELIRFIITNKGDDALFSRNVSTFTKILKSFKTKGLIQFFATHDSFLQNGTEAKYLRNKYPSLTEDLSTENSFFAYVKL